VVAYRQTTVRFECVRCGLRFSVDKSQLVERIIDINERIKKAIQREHGLSADQTRD
jgi:hypothetical protein